MNDPLSYCDEKAAAPGSDFALTRVFAPEEQRPALTALYALYVELMNVAYTVSDADLARAKLAWWHGELARAANGEANHPVAQALGERAPGLFAGSEPNELVRGALINVDPQAPADEPVLLDFARATGGVRARLECRIAGVEGTALEAAAMLGSASQLVRWLLLLPQDLARGRMLLPLSDLARFQLTRADLRRVGANANRDALIRARCEQILRLLDDGMARLPDQARKALRHLLVNAALDRAWCRRITRAGEDTFKRKPEFNPMARLFIAWRAAGQAQRPYRK